MSSRSVDCKARQHSDQMLCECGLGWDVNDPDPPVCTKQTIATRELDMMRDTIRPPNFGRGLKTLKAVPLNWLPAFGLPEGLLRVDWSTMPLAAFVVISKPVGDGPGRDYQFYDKKGGRLMDVQVREDYGSRTANMRHWVDGNTGGWQSA